MNPAAPAWQVTNVLKRLEGAMAGLHPAERKVASVVAAAPARVLEMSLAVLADTAGVSQPTAIRFCRTMGCTGFPDLKVRLAQAVAVGAPYVHREIGAADGLGQIADKVFASSMETLQSVRAGLDMEAIARAVEALSRAKRIELAGTGLSSVAALDAHHKFMRLGVATSFQPDSHVQRMAAVTLRPGDVALVFAYTGLVRDIVRIATLARGQGATVVSVTRRGTALAQASDVVIPVETQENTFVYAPMVTRLAHLAVVDVLATAVALRAGKRGLDTIKRVKRAVSDEWLIDADPEQAA